MADFEGNVGQDLAADMKKEAIEKEKILLEFKKSKAKLPVDLRKETVIDEKGEEIEEDGFSVYFPFKREDGTVENIKIATIDAKGTFNVNWNILNDEKFSKTERENLEKLLNGLGLDQDKVDINKMQEQLKELEEKQKEKDKNKDDKEKEEEETNKDDNEGKEEEEEKEDEKEKEVAEFEKEEEIQIIAKRKKIDSKNICKIRRDSKFYENYPHIPKTAYFYLDEKDKMRAEYIDKDGKIKNLEGFEEIKDTTTNVTRFGNGNESIKNERPYKVMSAEGLNDKNENTQEVRMALYKDEHGYLMLETIHQGKNGEWEGKNVDSYGREENTSRMNRIIDERGKAPKTGKIAERYEQLKNSGFSQDGIHFDELSKTRKIDEYMQEGYTREEANDIYKYVTGEMQLKEEDAKEKVNQEIAEKEENDGGRTPGGDALERRNRW